MLVVRMLLAAKPAMISTCTSKESEVAWSRRPAGSWEEGEAGRVTVTVPTSTRAKVATLVAKMAVSKAADEPERVWW